MTDLTPVATLSPVVQLETTDRALAGTGNPMNRQAQALLNRDAFRAQQITANAAAAAAAAADVVALRQDLANATDPAKGAALVGYRNSTVNAVIDRQVIFVGDLLGVTASHTAAIELAIANAKTFSASRIVLPNQQLSLICNEPGGLASFAAAVVIDGLHNCEIIGSGPNSELVAAVGGTGAAAFAHFRVQNSSNLLFRGFRIDGDYINHAGDTGNRSTGFILTTFDRDNTVVDLAPLRNIHFRAIECNDIGGFIWANRRADGQPYAPSLFNITVKDCWGVDAAQANNCIGFNFVVGGEVSSNNFSNTPTTTHYPSLYIDASRGCEDVSVHGNKGSTFVFGIKAEANSAGADYAPSKNIQLTDNELLEIGDPLTFTPAGAGSYGLRARGENVTVARNKVTARTALVAGGGLTSGVLVPLNDISRGTVNVFGNDLHGMQVGVVHNKTLSDVQTANCVVSRNKIHNVLLQGVVVQSDCTVEDNEIYNSLSSAVVLQLANNSRALRNRAFNCGGPSAVVYSQGDGGAGTTSGYFEFLDNEIHDTRGASAAAYGYFLQVAEDYSNSYRIRPGATLGLQTATLFGNYVGLFGRDDVKFSGQVNGAALSVVNGFNIASVTSVDANTIQINLRRPVPSTQLAVALNMLTGGKFFIPFGATTSTYRVRFTTSAGAVDTPSTFNVVAH